MTKSHIRTYARLKPSKNPDAQKFVIEAEKGENGRRFENLLFNVKGISGCSGEKIYKFRFKKIFDAISSQECIFEKIAKPIIEGVISGYNGTIFAYGQTGTGKTYSISGTEGVKDGIVPRAFNFLFKRFSKGHIKNEFGIWISIMEIYNELAYDLLKDVNEKKGHHNNDRVYLFENEKGEIEVKNLQLHHVTTMGDVRKLLDMGIGKRAIADTTMNEFSSRSHCVVTLYLTQGNSSSKIKNSKLHLVDLAGSEQMKTKVTSSQIFLEARQINLSLHYLEQVIIALANPKRSHIPYRNSVITSLLKDSLGGNCNTAMLATVSLELGNFKETIATCRFAQRVSLIRNMIKCNKEGDPKKELVHLKNEIERLKATIKKIQIECGPQLCGEPDMDNNNFKIRGQREKVALEGTSDISSVASHCLCLMYNYWTPNELSSLKQCPSIHNACEMKRKNETNLLSHQKTFYEYLSKQIEKGIGLMKTLIFEGRHCLSIGYSSNIKKFVQLLGINSYQLKFSKGQLYKIIDINSLIKFLRGEGKPCVEKFCYIASAFYSDLEKEWRLWRKAKETLDSLYFLNEVKKEKISSNFKKIQLKYDREYKQLESARQNRERNETEMAQSKQFLLRKFYDWLEMGQQDALVKTDVYLNLEANKNVTLPDSRQNVPFSSYEKPAKHLSREDLKQKRNLEIIKKEVVYPVILVKALLGKRVFRSLPYHAGVSSSESSSKSSQNFLHKRLRKGLVGKKKCPRKGFGLKIWRENFNYNQAKTVTIQIGQKLGHKVEWVSCKLMEDKKIALNQKKMDHLVYSPVINELSSTTNMNKVTKLNEVESYLKNMLIERSVKESEKDSCLNNSKKMCSHLSNTGNLTNKSRTCCLMNYLGEEQYQTQQYQKTNTASEVHKNKLYYHKPYEKYGRENDSAKIKNEKKNPFINSSEKLQQRRSHSEVSKKIKVTHRIEKSKCVCESNKTHHMNSKELCESVDHASNKIRCSEERNIFCMHSSNAIPKNHKKVEKQPKVCFEEWREEGHLKSKNVCTLEKTQKKKILAYPLDDNRKELIVEEVKKKLGINQDLISKYVEKKFETRETKKEYRMNTGHVEKGGRMNKLLSKKKLFEEIGAGDSNF